jgi:hypothetical protein
VARYVQFLTIFSAIFFRHLDLLPLSRIVFERAHLHCHSCALVVSNAKTVTHRQQASADHCWEVGAWLSNCLLPYGAFLFPPSSGAQLKYCKS